MSLDRLGNPEDMRAGVTTCYTTGTQWIFGQGSLRLRGSVGDLGQSAGIVLQLVKGVT